MRHISRPSPEKLGRATLSVVSVTKFPKFTKLPKEISEVKEISDVRVLSFVFPMNSNERTLISILSLPKIISEGS